MARGRRGLTVAAAAAGAVLVGAGVAAAAGGDGEHPVRVEQLWVTGVPEPGSGPGAGPVRLDATLYLPQGVGRVPAVLLAHGIGGSKADVADEAQRIAARGYVVLAWTARGFGRSGGLIHLDSPDYEVSDAAKLIDLLAARPEVQLDGPGDPRVGVAGGSYGGALALLLAGYDHRVDAIVPQITWNDLGHALFPQSEVSSPDPRSPAGIDPVGTPGVFKKGWAGVFFSPSGSAQAGLAASAGAAGPG
ncbi:MAG TPA: alpha/beta fold hydrolase, partial [Kineosporiaceae bacterium]